MVPNLDDVESDEEANLRRMKKNDGCVVNLLYGCVGVAVSGFIGSTCLISCAIQKYAPSRSSSDIAPLSSDSYRK